MNKKFREKVIKVDYYSGDGQSTYEIFKDVDKAYKFCKQQKVIRVSLADINNAYQEENGVWNYEDKLDTIQDEIIGEKNNERK